MPQTRMECRRWFSLAILSIATWACSISVGQESGSPTPEELEPLLQAANTSTELNDQSRAFVVDKYTQTLADLQTLASLSTDAKSFADQAQSAPSELSRLKREFENLPDKPEVAVLSAKSVEDAEASLDKAQKAHGKALDELTGLANTILLESDQRAELAEQITSANEQIDVLQKESPQSEIELPPSFADAPRLFRETRLRVARAQIEAAKNKLELLDATKDLVRLRRDKTKREVELLDEAVKQWTKRADQLRQIDATKQSVDASETKARIDAELDKLAEVNGDLKELASEDGELKQFAAKNVELAATLTSVNDDLDESRSAKLATTDRYGKLKTEFNEISTKLRSRGHVSEAIGGMLRANRKGLPDLRRRRRQSAERKTKIYDIEFAKMRIDDQLDEMEDMQVRLAAELEKLEEFVDDNRKRRVLSSLVEEMVEERRKTLKGLKGSYDAYATELPELDVKEDDLIALTEKYAAFVDERVLWIRSTPPVALADFRDSIRSVQWLSWNRFRKVGIALWGSLFDRPVANSACGVGLICLLIYRLRFRGHINELGKQAAARNCRDFSITLEVLAYTAARAATWPLVFVWIAWNLSFLDPDKIEFARPLSSSFVTVAALSYPILFWWRAVRIHGLAEAHLDWSTQKRQVTERSLRLVIPVILPAIALFEFYASSGKIVYEKSAGRFCFVVATICIAWCVGKLTSPQSGIFAMYLNRHRDQWFDQLKSIWYPAMIIIPLSFGLLALMGYQYTAAELLRRFYVSAAFLSGLYLLAAICLRWLLVNRRKLAIQQARERLAEFQQQQKAKAEAGGHAELPMSPTGETLDGVTESPHIDLSQVSMQSKRLLGSFTTMSALIGLYLIWIAVLPALAKLDDYQVWPLAAGDVVAAQPADSSSAAVSDNENGEPTGDSPVVSTVSGITLGEVITALVIIVMTIVAVQNIPGLLEIALLQRLPIDLSIRYAITTVTRYMIIIVGVAMAFSRVGIGWSQVQFLAAAISVGLGFGLQEIFANFMSGLILLFERPLRAGDVVTVGDVSGQVVQIRTRATTVRDWDCKELVVPNKEFITGKVLNWTLSDTVNRIVVNVGIAYGSDIKRARQILLDVAGEHPIVSDDPSPSVTFGAFGDSTLDFTLRCYVPNIDNRLSVVHELHEAIHDRLGEAGVEIPFPQRDLNFRSVDESVVARITDENRPRN